jgi:DNA-3-methyladenine glycosylase II
MRGSAYSISPPELPSVKSLSFTLRPVPPFRLDLTAWALRRRSHNIVDRWDGTEYRRVLVIGDEPLEASVTQSGTTDHPRLQVSLRGRRIREEDRLAAAGLLRRMLGLRTNLSPFYRIAALDKRLAPLAERFRGLKPPRFPSLFEGLANAIACQQLSLTVGIWVLNRLAEKCGPALRPQDSVHYAFPRPEDIRLLHEDDMRNIGFSRAKARYLHAVATDATLNVTQLERLGDQAVVERLQNFRGVGRWTAEYALLRGFGRTNVFPGDDVGARNRLAAWLGREGPMDYEAVRRSVRRWQPYSGLVYFHLLLDGLSRSGMLIEGPQDGARVPGSGTSAR